MELDWAETPIRMPKKPLLTKSEVCLYLEGIGEDALDSLIASGAFPPPIRISPGTLRWKNLWVGVYLAWAEMTARAPGPAARRGGKSAPEDDTVS